MAKAVAPIRARVAGVVLDWTKPKRRRIRFAAYCHDP
jgi:hypothetical protein